MSGAITEDPGEILRLLEQLGAISAVRHGAHGTLAAHLSGVWAILHDWQLPAYICSAGLCHSVYGTESFQSATLQEQHRPSVRNIIGTEGERLAYLFGHVQQRSLLTATRADEVRWMPSGSDTQLSDADHSALLHILAANTLDQFAGRDLMNRAVMTALAPVWAEARSRLRPNANEAMSDAFERARLPRVFCAVLLFMWPMVTKARFAFSGMRRQAAHAGAQPS